MSNKIKYWSGHVIGCVLVLACALAAGDRGIGLLAITILASITAGIFIHSMDAVFRTPLLKGFVVVGGATLMASVAIYLFG